VKASVPSFLQFTPQGYVAATHLNYSLLGPTTLYPGASTPASPGEMVTVYGVGWGLPTSTLIAGSSSQSGSLPSLPVCTIENNPTAVAFSGVISPGLYQFNVTVPPASTTGDKAISCSYAGTATPVGNLVTVR